MKTKKISYQKEPTGGFYHILKARVKELMEKEKEKSYYPGKKALLLLSAYLLALSAIYSSATKWILLSAYIILGLLTTIIFLNVIHDAAHNALFQNTTLNSMALKLLILFGADEYIWKKRHLVSHHTYPNIIEKDYDIRQSGVIRIVPQKPFLVHHRLQPYYVPVLYFFYSLNWFLRRDFNDAFVNAKELHVSNAMKIKMILKKVLYLFFILILPAALNGHSFSNHITGFFLMHFTASVIGVLALTTSHVSEDAEFPIPDESRMMPDSWAEHQLRVTQDFGTRNYIINNCFGGFNFHVAHHLFPSIQHRHYQKITEIIKVTAEEFGLNYKSKSLSKALRSHYNLLLNNSRQAVEIDL